LAAPSSELCSGGGAVTFGRPTGVRLAAPRAR